MKTALIGLGMVADTHLWAIRDADPKITLTGILGRDPARAATFAEKASQTLGYVVPAFESLDRLVASEIDFAVLATPPDARRDIVETLADAGIPILMEKPVERTLSGAQEIVSICETARVPLGIMFQHRARAASKALKNVIDAGTLGDIATLDIRIPWWRDQAYYDAPGRGTYARDGGGVMINQAIHTLDLVLWLLGPMRTIQAMMRQTTLHRMEAEDWAGALFEMQNGAVGTLVATTAAYPGDAESITIQGTHASAHLASGVLTLRHLNGPVEVLGDAALTGGGADPMAFTHAWHQSILQDFTYALENATDPLCTGRDALQAHAVIDAMEQSAKTGIAIKVTPL